MARGDVTIVFPVHPNLDVHRAIAPVLSDLPNVAPISPLVYPRSVRLVPREFHGAGAALVDLDSALASCDLLIVLVDHEIFKPIPFEERREIIVNDACGPWPDQQQFSPVQGMRMVD